jgi:transcriptional regulator with XRE-family HTH domain
LAGEPFVRITARAPNWATLQALVTGPRPQMAKSGDPKSRPRAIDVYVGSRIRLRRKQLGMSQERLGDALDLTGEQVEKYENGSYRMRAARLFELSRIIDVPISFFFCDSTTDISSTSSTTPTGRRQTEISELVQAYYQIIDPMVRNSIFRLIRSMGENETPIEAPVTDAVGQREIVAAESDAAAQ